MIYKNLIQFIQKIFKKLFLNAKYKHAIYLKIIRIIQKNKKIQIKIKKYQKL